MDVKLKNGEFVIKLPMETPRSSSAKETLLVAGTRGRQATSVKVNGSTVWIVANLFTYPQDDTSGAEPTVSEAPKKKGRKKR